MQYFLQIKNCSLLDKVIMESSSLVALCSVTGSVYQRHMKYYSLFFSPHHFQDYHWQWRSFLTSGFTAVYFLIYAIHYFFSKLQITGTASTILYFGYTMIMVLIFFLFTGKYIEPQCQMLSLPLALCRRSLSETYLDTESNLYIVFDFCRASFVSFSNSVITNSNER